MASGLVLAGKWLNLISILKMATKEAVGRINCMEETMVKRRQRGSVAVTRQGIVEDVEIDDGLLGKD